MKYILGPLFQSDQPITQRYGENPDYYKQFGLPGHEGTDYGTPNGTPFIAPFNGVILRDTFGDKDYGNFTVVWDSTQKCAVWLCHLQDITTKVGDTVTKGQVLGHTNNTGNSSGPHCHVNFVETDDQGNRLNKDNGYQGFLNILDTNLVQFEGSPITPPSDDALTACLTQHTDLVNQCNAKDQQIDSQKQVIDNLNSQINDRNNNITTLQGEISTLKTSLLGAQGQVDILTPIAKQVPDLKTQLDQAINDRSICLGAQEGQNRKIATLEQQLTQQKPKGFVNKLLWLFS